MEAKFLSVVVAAGDQVGYLEVTPSHTRHLCVGNGIMPLVWSGEPRDVVTSP